MKPAVAFLFVLGAMISPGNVSAQTDSLQSQRHDQFQDRERDFYRPWHGTVFLMANAEYPSVFGVEAGGHISDIAGIGFTASIGDVWSSDPAAVKVGLAAEIYIPLRSAVTPYIHGAIGSDIKLFSSDSYGLASIGAMIKSEGSTSNWLQFRAEAGPFFASRYVSGGFFFPRIDENKIYFYIMFGVEINS